MLYRIGVGLLVASAAMQFVRSDHSTWDWLTLAGWVVAIILLVVGRAQERRRLP